MMRDVATMTHGETVSFTAGPRHTIIAGRYGGLVDGRVLVITPNDVWSRPLGDVVDVEGRELGVPDVEPVLPTVPPELE